MPSFYSEGTCVIVCCTLHDHATTASTCWSCFSSMSTLGLCACVVTCCYANTNSHVLLYALECLHRCISRLIDGNIVVLHSLGCGCQDRTYTVVSSALNKKDAVVLHRWYVCLIVCCTLHDRATPASTCWSCCSSMSTLALCACVVTCCYANTNSHVLLYALECLHRCISRLIDGNILLFCTRLLVVVRIAHTQWYRAR